MPFRYPILLVDDDPQVLESTRRLLEWSDHKVITAMDGQEAFDWVRRNAEQAFIVVSDLRMPRMGGVDFFQALSVTGVECPVIFMTAFGSVDTAVSLMKRGAVDFISKPFGRQTLLDAIASAAARLDRRVRRSGASASTSSMGSAWALDGRSESIRALRVLLERVASSTSSVLVLGESGSGKERVARTLHDQSSRRVGPFVAWNCAALPEGLVDAELFGAEKGAYTGLTQARVGLFEQAHQGTLFLDEVGDLPLASQAKLLRVLQEGEVRRLGGSSTRRVDVRIIAATHRDLRARVREGLFREDLLYRLDVISVTVPPLRERRDDIASLITAIFTEFVDQSEGAASPMVSPEALRALEHYEWPGNIRELRNVLERAYVLCDKTKIELSHLPDHISRSASGGASLSISIPLGTPLDEVESLLIQKTLEATQGDKQMTAKLLGVASRTIYRKLDRRDSTS